MKEKVSLLSTIVKLSVQFSQVDNQVVSAVLPLQGIPAHEVPFHFTLHMVAQTVA